MSARRHKWICAAIVPALSTTIMVSMAVGMTTVMTGCSHFASRPAASTRVAKKERQRIRKLERELQKTKLQLEDLKERNIVLERKSGKGWDGMPQASAVTHHQVPVPFHPSAQAGPSSAAPASAPAHTLSSESHAPHAAGHASGAILKDQTKIVEPAANKAAAPGAHKPLQPLSKAIVESVGSAQTGEHYLYSKILETYRKKNTAEMEQSLRLLLKTYPDSVFADNAIYLSGLLAFESQELPRAKKIMSRVVADYPRGNKAVAALFARASIEKKMGLFGEARRTLHKLKKIYPGSPEAERVAVELKLIDLEASKRRET